MDHHEALTSSDQQWLTTLQLKLYKDVSDFNYAEQNFIGH